MLGELYAQRASHALELAVVQSANDARRVLGRPASEELEDGATACEARVGVLRRTGKATAIVWRAVPLCTSSRFHKRARIQNDLVNGLVG